MREVLLVGAFDRYFYPPVVRFSDLQHELAGRLVDAPALALREDGLEGGAAVEEGDGAGGAVYSEGSCGNMVS